MRIAYLILCHSDPDHIARLVRKITEHTDNEAFIHVDAKCDITPFHQLLQGWKQAHFLSTRTNVRWGGYSAIEATVNLMRCALKKGGFERFVFLQGLEYPILSNQRLDEFFTAHPRTEFLLAQNISTKKDWHEEHKYRLFWDLDHAKRIDKRVIHLINRLFLKAKRIPHLRRSYAADMNGRKMDIHQGCAQFGITAEAARYIVDFHDNNPCFNRYFRKVYAVDEAYFHTILYNSEFVNVTPDGKAVNRPHLTDFENLTYFEYPDIVTLFTSPDEWPRIKNSGFLYFRKASSLSGELLDVIDQEHMNEENEGWNK